MKKLVVLFTALCLCVSMAGCDLTDYRTAMDYYEAGEYAQALEIYRALGDYADSREMAEICWQKADYQAAEQLYAAGDYRQALPLYQGLAMYMDSPAKAIDCQYAIGVGSMEAAEYGEAITWLESVGNYKDSLARIKQSKWLWICSRVREQAPALEFNGGMVTLTANDADKLELSYRKDGALLGVTYTNAFTLTVGFEEEEAVFTAKYDSASAGSICEEAAGVVKVPYFTAEKALSPDTFTQTVVDNDGVETVSTQTTDALMMQQLLAEAQTVLSQYLSQLLAQTELPVTVKDMGFVSLE